MSSFIIEELYEMNKILNDKEENHLYRGFKGTMCETFLWRKYSLFWKVKYLNNLIISIV